MLSAQDSPMGVPKEMLEAKKLELQQEQVRVSSRIIQKW
jgi:serine/arginine repetitive matrix protein 1